MRPVSRPSGADEAPVGTGADQLAHGSSASLTTQLVEEMVAAWRHGERPAAESFLARHPNFGTESALRLIHEEVCLRHEVGLEVVAADVVNRFPQWRAELELLLDCQRLMQGRRSSAVFPEVGELLSGFELVAELGRGASGRVFLALQNSLASRPVILKVTACVQEEHLALARLQHMNIVPLYSEEVLPSRNQRMLCMPYLGGATLARLLELLRDRPASTRSGKHLIDALDQAQLALPVQFPSQGPYRGTLARAPYVQAIAWIGACLADGLQYAPRSRVSAHGHQAVERAFDGRRPADAPRFPSGQRCDRSRPSFPAGPRRHDGLCLARAKGGHGRDPPGSADPRPR